MCLCVVYVFYCAAVCLLVILLSVANLIAPIGEHCVPLSLNFTLDTVKGLLVYFNQLYVHYIGF